MVLSGGLIPVGRTRRILEKSKIPVLISEDDTYSVASAVHHILVKLKPQDTAKIKIIVDIVEKNIDIDNVLASLT